jgi:RecA/RadA recombinase
MKGHVAEVVHHEDGTLGFKYLPPERVQMCVVYIDNEGSLDDDGKLIVDGEKLDVVGARVDTTDDMFKMIQEVLEFQKERIEKQKDDGIFRGMLIVVDTIASTSTRQELEQKWGTQDFPRQPQQISRGFRQLIRDINRYQTAVLLTNQARVKFNTGGAPSYARSSGGVILEDYTSVGGMALRFYSTQRVFMYATNQKYKLMPNENFPSGMLVGFSTVKNRNLPPWRTAKLVLLFGKNGGFNDLYSRLETMVQWGFIEEGSETRHTDFVLKFNKHGIIPETFDTQTLHSSLDEDEDAPLTVRRGGRKKEPGFKVRAEWPSFYAAHQSDIDKLWQAALVEACRGHLEVKSGEDLVANAESIEAGIEE